MSYISEVCGAVTNLCFGQLPDKKQDIARWLLDKANEFNISVDIVAAHRGEIVFASKPFSFMDYYDEPEERFRFVHKEPEYWEKLFKDNGLDVSVEFIEYVQSPAGKEGYYFRIKEKK